MLHFGCESLKLKSWTPKTIASEVKLHKESELIEQDLKNLVKFVRATIAYWNWLTMALTREEIEAALKAPATHTNYDWGQIRSDGQKLLWPAGKVASVRGVTFIEDPKVCGILRPVPDDNGRSLYILEEVVRAVGCYSLSEYTELPRKELNRRLKELLWIITIMFLEF